MNDFSITIGIPTYNRADSLNDLLGQFEEAAKECNPSNYNVVIIISDNASADNTKEIVESYKDKLERCGYELKYYKQSENRGMDGNFRFIYEKCDTDYLWYFSDDDILIQENILSTLNDVGEYNPDVCLSNFEQSPYTAEKTIFLSDCKSDKKIIDDEFGIFSAIIKYPKITNYIIRKYDIEPYDKLISDCVGNYYLFIVFSLIAVRKNGRLLLRKASIAKSRDDYMSIEYTPRAFAGLQKTLLMVQSVFKNDELEKLVNNHGMYEEIYSSLKFVTLHNFGRITLPKKIVEDERRYIKDNFYYVCSRPKLIARYVVFQLSRMFNWLSIL